MSQATTTTVKNGVVVAERYHDISCGHRVSGHESKCAHLHGHNYRVTFWVAMNGGNKVDSIGRVMDFSVIKSKLCMWLEENWDHKFLAWRDDPLMKALYYETPGHVPYEAAAMFQSSIVWTPFNPTAENIAEHLVNVVGPEQLHGTGCVLMAAKVEETRKCSAMFFGDPDFELASAV